MAQGTTNVGGKKVCVADCYEPRFLSPLVGRTDVMKKITAAWMGGETRLPLSPLLVGEPGVGKNRIVYELARRTAKRLYIFQGHEDVTAEDLAFTVRIVEDRKIEYVASPLVTAMLDEAGGICFIDEIAKIRPRALALLVSVLDDRRNIYSTLFGQTVSAAEGFRFIAATNSADLAGSALPEFLLSRMRPIIEVGSPEPEDLKEIVQTNYPRLQGHVGPLIDKFWELWHKKHQRHSDGAPAQSNHETAPSARDIIHLFGLALSLADCDANNVREHLKAKEWKDPILLTGGHTGVMLDESHVETAFQELFDHRVGQKP